MIRVAVETREGSLSHRTRVTAPFIERALEVAGGGNLAAGCASSSR